MTEERVLRLEEYDDGKEETGKEIRLMAGSE